MQAYKDFAPTAFDSAGAFLPERQDWLVIPVSQTRDSGPIDESNFSAALDILGGESDTVEVHRFGHWGPGWFEIIIVAPSREADAQAIAERLESYPVLDDEDFSDREHADATESWDSWGRSEWRRKLSNAYPDVSDAIDDATDDALDLLANGGEPGIPEYETGSDGPHFPCINDRAPVPTLADVVATIPDACGPHDGGPQPIVAPPIPDHPGQARLFPETPGADA